MLRQQGSVYWDSLHTWACPYQQKVFLKHSLHMDRSPTTKFMILEQLIYTSMMSCYLKIELLYYKSL